MKDIYILHSARKFHRNNILVIFREIEFSGKSLKNLFICKIWKLNIADCIWKQKGLIAYLMQYTFVATNFANLQIFVEINFHGW